MTPSQIVSYIDHTILKADASKDDVIKLCSEAREHNFFSVCVNSVYASLAVQQLSGCPVKVCSVVGFPLGASLSQVKSHEARLCIDKGVVEIDMVANIASIKAQDERIFLQDIESVLNVCRLQSVLLKVIVESSLLSLDEIAWSTKMVEKSGAEFIKTSTGFAGAQASIEAVQTMKKNIQSQLLIKASGGIRDLLTMQKMIEAGASRIGTSSGVKIVEQAGNL
jgi:deoxyribose-phosphate aldolase